MASVINRTECSAFLGSGKGFEAEFFETVTLNFTNHPSNALKKKPVQRAFIFENKGRVMDGGGPLFLKIKRPVPLDKFWLRGAKTFKKGGQTVLDLSNGGYTYGANGRKLQGLITLRDAIKRYVTSSQTKQGDQH